MIFTSIFNALTFSYKIGAGWTTRSRLIIQLIRRGLAVRNSDWYKQIVAEQKTKVFNVRTPHLRQLYLRTQDMPIFMEIFKRKDYCLPLEKSLNEAAIVVDLGANIGLASIFFQQHYFPNARFIAVEPSPKNILVLQKNLITNIPSAEIVPVVINDKVGLVQIDDTDVGFNVHVIDAQNRQITEGDVGTEVAALTMTKLMEQCEIERIALLKMDIEGAEKQVLSSDNAWLSKVDMLIVEIHNDYTERQLRFDIEPFGFQILKANAKHLYLAKRENMPSY